MQLAPARPLLHAALCWRQGRRELCPVPARAEGDPWQLALARSLRHAALCRRQPRCWAAIPAPAQLPQAGQLRPAARQAQNVPGLQLRAVCRSLAVCLLP